MDNFDAEEAALLNYEENNTTDVDEIAKPRDENNNNANNDANVDVEDSDVGIDEEDEDDNVNNNAFGRKKKKDKGKKNVKNEAAPETGKVQGASVTRGAVNAASAPPGGQNASAAPADSAVTEASGESSNTDAVNSKKSAADESDAGFSAAAIEADKLIVDRLRLLNLEKKKLETGKEEDKVDESEAVVVQTDKLNKNFNAVKADKKNDRAGVADKNDKANADKNDAKVVVIAENNDNFNAVVAEEVDQNINQDESKDKNENVRSPRSSSSSWHLERCFCPCVFFVLVVSVVVIVLDVFLYIAIKDLRSDVKGIRTKASDALDISMIESQLEYIEDLLESSTFSGSARRVADDSSTSKSANLTTGNSDLDAIVSMLNTTVADKDWSKQLNNMEVMVAGTVITADEMLEEEQSLSEQLRRVISTQAEILAKQKKISPIT